MRFALWLSATAAITAASSVFHKRAQKGDTDVLSPTSDYCSRWAHQSAIKADHLYVNGGVETYDIGGGHSVLGYNKFLVKMDMTDSWVWDTPVMNLSETPLRIPKDEETGLIPPSLIQGSMFQGPDNDSRIYSLGGKTSPYNESFVWNVPPESSKYSLWSYDTDSSKWEPYDVQDEVPVRPNNGAYTEAPDQGLAFWFGGQIDRWSATETAGMGKLALPIDGMLVVNLNDQTARNVSTVQFTGVPRTGAVVQYVPGIGKQGILVMFGGLSPVGDSAYLRWDGDGQLHSFSEIYIFDIASYLSDRSSGGKWYKQVAGGVIPPARTGTCLVVASAPDNSSHNIYLYAGVDPTDGTGKIIDDIYALSLPSFTWAHVFSGKSPRFGHTCHSVGNDQMITVGGSLSTDFQGCDWEWAGVGVYHMSQNHWDDKFDAYAAPYQVTPAIVSMIGGTPAGNATITTPVKGFSSPELETLMRTVRGSSPPANSSSGLSSGAIVGAVVGTTIAILIILVVLFLVLRRRGRLRRAQQHQSLPDIPDTSSTTPTPFSPHALGATETGGVPVAESDARGRHELNAYEVIELASINDTLAEKAKDAADGRAAERPTELMDTDVNKRLPLQAEEQPPSIGMAVSPVEERETEQKWRRSEAVSGEN